MEKNERNRIIAGIVILSILMTLYTLSGCTPRQITPKVKVTRNEIITCVTSEDGEVVCREK